MKLFLLLSLSLYLSISLLLSGFVSVSVSVFEVSGSGFKIIDNVSEIRFLVAIGSDEAHTHGLRRPAT